MPEDAFGELGNLLAAGDPHKAFAFLVERYRAARDYRALFEARLMSKRWELGLPVYQLQDLAGIAPELQSAYSDAVSAVAREVGELFLADGEIPSAWPYLRASGNLERMTEALEAAEPGENVDELIQIAFQEGVHPAKGLEWILKKYGICQAISALGMAQVEKDRERCIALLTGSLHRETLDRIAQAIESAEGAAPPAADTIAELIAGRDWLFGEYSAYVDTSHLASMLQYSLDVSDPALLRQFHDLCIYGKHLSAQFHIAGQVPLEQGYVDYDHYVLALLGDESEDHVEHFRRKMASGHPLHPQLLVKLLTELGRYREAFELAMEHFPNERAGELNCLPAMELSHLAKEFDRMKAMAQERGDLLTYAAAVLESHVGQALPPVHPEG